MIVTLIGYRGCGKSSVGPLLAERLHCRSVDSDDEIESRAGKAIREIFSDDGEAEFRRLETEVLKELLSGTSVVIAAGGGAVLADVNRERMKAAGPVVWLTAPASTLAARIGADESSGSRRPSLTGKLIEEEVADVLRDRLERYADAATIIVDADQQTPEQITDDILKQLCLEQQEATDDQS